MSYWVYLRHPSGEVAEVPQHYEGGTIAIGGETGAMLNITYNYARVYGELSFSIRDLHNCMALDWIVRLGIMADVLGTERDKDNYWAATRGNAGHVLNILLGWAKLHPQATFEVS